jgi:type II secretory pathway pseudopilin PulG
MSKTHLPHKIPSLLQRSKGHSFGQTLIEVLIATAVVGLVITAVAAGMTYSIKSTSNSQYRTLATEESQQVIEFLRRERSQIGWESFVEQLPSGQYCVNELPNDADGLDGLVLGACSQKIIKLGTEWDRQLTVTTSNATSFEYYVTITWKDGDQTREVQVDGDLKPWLK